MKRQPRSNASSLFLIELILSILFFSITGAVCVQIFVKSHTLIRDSEALSQSVNLCSSAAEICQTADGSHDAMSLLIEQQQGEARYTEPDTGDTVVSIFYDQHFSPCRESDSAYCMTITLSEENSMLTSQIRMDRLPSEESIYELAVSHYLGKEDTHNE